jgi:transcriptional regulator with XRE-family HTH domain
MPRVNIEAERARLQMTKSDMCKALGVTLKTYGEYVNGGTIPSPKLEKLREITGKSIDYLLGFK